MRSLEWAYASMTAIHIRTFGHRYTPREDHMQTGIFDKDSENTRNGKGSVLSQWCWETGSSCVGELNSTFMSHCMENQPKMDEGLKFKKKFKL